MVAVLSIVRAVCFDLPSGTIVCSARVRDGFSIILHI